MNELSKAVKRLEDENQELRRQLDAVSKGKPRFYLKHTNEMTNSHVKLINSLYNNGPLTKPELVQFTKVHGATTRLNELKGINFIDSSTKINVKGKSFTQYKLTETAVKFMEAV